MTGYSRLKRRFRACSPRHHPHRWLVVNGVILTWSAFLLVRIFATGGSYVDDDKAAVELHYLIYNIVTCCVWLLEVLLNVLDYNEFFDDGDGGGEAPLMPPPIHDTENATNKMRALWIEGGIAAFFFAESAMAAVHLSRNEVHRQAEGMTMWVIINIVAYIFMVYRLFVDWQTMRQGAKQTELISGLHSTTLV
jgi:hypothetical protein